MFASCAVSDAAPPTDAPAAVRVPAGLKVLLAGDWAYEMYEPAFARALAGLDANVSRFVFRRGNGLLSRLEHRYSLAGPSTRRATSELIAACEAAQPSLVLIWLGAGVRAEVIESIRQRTGAIVAAYVHDDPFAHRHHRLSPGHHRYHWRPFLAALPSYDLVLFAKEASAADARRSGARHAGVLRQYYVPWIHKPQQLDAVDIQRFSCDAAFAGHFEADGREEALIALADAGLDVNVYQGAMWNRSRQLRGYAAASPRLKALPPAMGEDYPKALAAARMALCFLSKMNRDVYTTRCFEIPACGSLLLCERTPELTRMYREDQEAVFFSSTAELLEKAQWLKEHPDERNRIAQAGHRRVLEDGHSVHDRARRLLQIVTEQRGH